MRFITSLFVISKLLLYFKVSKLLTTFFLAFSVVKLQWNRSVIGENILLTVVNVSRTWFEKYHTKLWFFFFILLIPSKSQYSIIAKTCQVTVGTSAPNDSVSRRPTHSTEKSRVWFLFATRKYILHLVRNTTQLTVSARIAGVIIIT